MSQTEWVDRQGYWVVLLIPAVLVGQALWIVRRGLLEHHHGFVIFGAAYLGMLLLSCLASRHYLPLRITDDKIFLASGRFPSVKRTQIPLSAIKKITITHSKYFDEGAGWSPLEFVRVEDEHGRQYRNVIYGVSEFKKFVHGRLQDDVMNDNEGIWTKILPKNWR